MACDRRSPSRLARAHQCPSTPWPHAFYRRPIRAVHRRIIKRGNLHGTVTTKECSWHFTTAIYERSSLDQSLIFDVVPFCICNWSARFFNQGFTSPDDQFWTNSVIIEGTVPSIMTELV